MCYKLKSEKDRSLYYKNNARIYCIDLEDYRARTSNTAKLSSFPPTFEWFREEFLGKFNQIGAPSLCSDSDSWGIKEKKCKSPTVTTKMEEQYGTFDLGGSKINHVNSERETTARGFIIRWVSVTTTLTIFPTPTIALEPSTHIRGPFMPYTINSAKVIFTNQRLMNEYKIWKKNKPFLYDMVITHTLECPSFTVEWLPDREEPTNKDYSVQKLICDTHIFVNEPTYLMLTQVQLPLEDAENDTCYYDDDRADVGGFTFLISIYVNSSQFSPTKDPSHWLSWWYPKTHGCPWWHWCGLPSP